jgi:hypothetical protein
VHIDSYNFGEITIDGKVYTSDVIIYKVRVDDSWRRMEGHKLSIADLEDILQKNPDILIIGTGEAGVMKVPPDVISALEAKGIKVIVMKTGDACKEYNKISTSANVAAALHLTC